MSRHQLALHIKEKAISLGFSACGIAPVEELENDAKYLQQWIDAGFHAGMSYMARNFEKRTDPGKLVTGARSVIVLLFNYFPEREITSESVFKISKYAYGNDYHEVIKKKLNILCDELIRIDNKAVARGFVDSAPVLERAWATRAGLGWIGKNSMLITRKKGSFFFLAEIITSLEPEYDQPFGGNYCGDCSRCLDACPTRAIIAPGVVDARRCISFLTIENKGEIPENFKGNFDNWIFGCDVCQDVCPWNRFAEPHSEPELAPKAGWASLKTDDWLGLDDIRFKELFGNSAVSRCKFKGLRRNIEFVCNSP